MDRYLGYWPATDTHICISSSCFPKRGRSILTTAHLEAMWLFQEIGRVTEIHTNGVHISTLCLFVSAWCHSWIPILSSFIVRGFWIISKPSCRTHWVEDYRTTQKDALKYLFLEWNSNPQMRGHRAQHNIQRSEEVSENRSSRVYWLIDSIYWLLGSYSPQLCDYFHSQTLHIETDNETNLTC